MPLLEEGEEGLSCDDSCNKSSFKEFEDADAGTGLVTMGEEAGGDDCV